MKPEPAHAAAAWPERGASPSGGAGGEPGGAGDPGAAGEGGADADPDPGQAPGSDAEAMDVDEAAMRAGSQQVAPTAGDPPACLTSPGRAAGTSAPARDTLLSYWRLHGLVYGGERPCLHRQAVWQSPSVWECEVVGHAPVPGCMWRSLGSRREQQLAEAARGPGQERARGVPGCAAQVRAGAPVRALHATDARQCARAHFSRPRPGRPLAERTRAEGRACGARRAYPAGPRRSGSVCAA